MTRYYDQKFIGYALNLAKKNLGLTSPNPVVGCVITIDNSIISTGVTAIKGRPHAEKIAIDKISNKEILKKATIYITLEPCSHFGKTGPCVDEIIKYQFKRVVIATTDPDSRVNGKSIAKLKENNIDFTCGVLEEEAKELNRAFFKTKTKNQPFITLKLATSLDGKIATKSFDSKWITSKKARQFSHYLRSINDAIMVGANTLRKDNPKLDCRVLGLENHSPKIITISQNLNLDPNLNIFKSDKPIIITSSKNQNSLEAEIILCDEKNGKIDLEQAFQKLCEYGINSILIEGGQKLSTQLLQENLVDELIWIRNKKIIGNDGIPAVSDLSFEKIDDVINNFRKIETKEFAEDLVEIYRP